MLQTGKRIKRKRLYSETFKLQIVKEYESGNYTVRELMRLYDLVEPTVYNWIYKYSTYNKKSIQVVEMKDSSAKKLKDLEQQIKDLQEAVGRKQMNIDYLEKMIDLAKDHYDIDIKKNSDTPLSGGSKTIKKK